MRAFESTIVEYNDANDINFIKYLVELTPDCSEGYNLIHKDKDKVFKISLYHYTHNNFKNHSIHTLMAKYLCMYNPHYEWPINIERINESTMNFINQELHYYKGINIMALKNIIIAS